MWLLTAEEIDRLRVETLRTIGVIWPSFDYKVALVAARKIAEEGEKPCQHEWNRRKGFRHSRHECPECWAELKQEAGL